MQGLCKVEDKYLLSAYDYKHSNNSIIYILDEDLNDYKIKELDTTAHVGGITYDPVHKNIWITDNKGTISAYNKDDFFNSERKIHSKYKNIFVGDKLNNLLGQCSAAYITYNDKKLYIGNYNNRNNTLIKEYKIRDDGMIDTSSYNEIEVSEYIQGITFYEDREKSYLIVSSSYGRFIPSKLQVYDCSNYKKVKEIRTNSMMEEIIIDGDKLITLYESNAKIYNREGADIIISDINKIITKK